MQYNYGNLLSYNLSHVVEVAYPRRREQKGATTILYSKDKQRSILLFFISIYMWKTDN